MSETEREPTIDDVEERIYKIEMQQASFATFKAYVEVIAIILAGAWAFYQFIYQDKIKPLSETPSLTVTATLEKLGTRGPWQAVRATETVVNDSKIRVSILARTVNLAGFTVVDKPKAGAFALQGGTWNVNRSYQMSRPVFLQSHSVFFSGDARSGNRRWWLEPGDTATQSAIYFVKIGQFDTVRFDANYQYTKYDLVPAFAAFVAPSGERDLGPAKMCVDYDESPNCPITGTTATSALSLW